MDVPSGVDAELQELTDTLAKLDALMRNPELQAHIGDGLARELRYPIASYRQRFPQLWPAAQPSLF